MRIKLWCRFSHVNLLVTGFHVFWINLIICVWGLNRVWYRKIKRKITTSQSSWKMFCTLLRANRAEKTAKNINGGGEGDIVREMSISNIFFLVNVCKVPVTTRKKGWFWWKGKWRGWVSTFVEMFSAVFHLKIFQSNNWTWCFSIRFFFYFHVYLRDYVWCMGPGAILFCRRRSHEFENRLPKWGHELEKAVIGFNLYDLVEFAFVG